MKKIILISLVLLFSELGFSQKVKWISFEQAVEKTKKEPRKIIIDIYTDWCHWCNVMDTKTYSNPEIAKYINKHYYAVKLNAETLDTIKFKGHVFVNRQIKARYPNDFAIALLQGKLSYPSFVFMNENLEVITVLKGFLDPKKFEPYLNYISQGEYLKKIKFDDYLNTFKSKL